jgi:hypothetical protein
MFELRAVFAEMAREVRDAAGEMGPSIRGALIEGLKTLAHWAAVAARAVGILATQLARSFAPAAAGAGGGPTGAESSIGAAARAAHISGFEEYERQLQVAAFREPGMAADPGLAAAQASAASLAQIDQEAQQLASTLTEWAGSVMSVLRGIWDVLKMIWNFIKGIYEIASMPSLAVEDTMRGIRAGESVPWATIRGTLAAPFGGRWDLGR